MPHKAGYVNIIGSPNAGKSTLMNALVGEKLSIITKKIQTTRHRILGIINEKDYQIILSDTPGLLKPHYKLHEAMMKHIDEAFQDADIFIFIQDVNESFESEEIIQRLHKTEKHLIIALNKIDLSDQEKVEKESIVWQEKFPNAKVIPISALHNFNVDTILNMIVKLLPESPAYYPKDTLTDKNIRFFVSEIIREKILLNFQKEIPYSAEVTVYEYKEDTNIIRIKAYIHVARDTQKGIILGHQGKAIKKLGTDARKDIEEFVGKKVHLELTVKVSKDWRNSEEQLKRFGYEE